MRVLMLKRSGMGTGGEVTQMRELGAGLGALGVEVIHGEGAQTSIEDVDLVHVFGLTQPAEPLLQAQRARRRRVPVVLSPAYQRLKEYDRRGRYGLARWAYRFAIGEAFAEVPKQLARTLTSPHRTARAAALAFVPYRRLQKQLLEHTSLLLPNSRAEAAAIATDVGVGPDVEVVFNGAARQFASGAPEAFVDRYGVRDFVLAVGFITSLKNQLRLIRALDGTGLRLVVVGANVASHAAYGRAVGRAAAERSWVTMTGPMPPQELASAYAAARVVALPSWFETCGLVGLEGALAGCRVVMTNRGYGREYFEDDAAYCDPGDEASIRGAVLDAYERPAPDRLRERVLKEFTWEAASLRTLQAYQRVLEVGAASSRRPERASGPVGA